MKILYIVSNLRPSGPTNQIYNLINNFNKNHDISILTLSPESGKTLVPDFETAGVKYISLNYSRLEGLFLSPIKLKSVVNDINPDIIHTHGIRADTLCYLFLSNYPQISTIHNYPYADYPAQYGLIFGNFLSIEHILIYKYIDYPVGCSKSVTNKMSDHNIDAHTIQNGVELSDYSVANPEKKSKLREKHNLQQTGPIFISSGPIISRKNHKTIIRGFLESGLVDECSLVIFGDGPLLDSCKKLADSVDSIIIKGWVEDINELLSASDYYVSASLGEGLPIAVLEALASGLPVCLSDIDPHQEILQNSDSGRIFSKKNPHDLAKSMKNLVTKNHSDLSSSARSRIINHFNAERMAKEYEKLYHNIKNNESNQTVQSI